VPNRVRRTRATSKLIIMLAFTASACSTGQQGCLTRPIETRFRIDPSATYCSYMGENYRYICRPGAEYLAVGASAGCTPAQTAQVLVWAQKPLQPTPVYAPQYTPAPSPPLPAPSYGGGWLSEPERDTRPIPVLTPNGGFFIVPPMSNGAPWVII
jgi:hypothetical protein